MHAKKRKIYFRPCNRNSDYLEPFFDFFDHLSVYFFRTVSIDFLYPTDRLG
jgi:hypothetical protein